MTDIRHGEWVYLGSGDDRMTDVKGLGGVSGGPGDDRFTLLITTIEVDAGPGDDTLRAVPGGPPHFPYNIAFNSPCMSYRTAPGPVRVDLLGGPDRVHGDSGDDFVETAAGADYLEGGDGRDVLHAGYRCDGGNSGGAGTVDQLPNEVFGGPGNDHLTGDLGNDRIDGGSGLDEGHGGHEDGRIDWVESLEKVIVCQTPY